MKKAKYIILVILIIFLVFVLVHYKIKNKSKSVADITVISSQEFEGFDKCEISEKLADTITELITSGKPIKKEKDSWTYAIKSEVMGLPVKEMEVGVCNESGMQSCGRASLVVLVIAKPLKDSASHLKQTGTDYTEEKLDDNTKMTLRPTLIGGKKSDESILYCDPGTI